MLSHPPATVDQQNGIGRKDCITVWDWLEFPKAHGFGLAFYPVKQRNFKEPVGDKCKFLLLPGDRIIPETRNLIPNNGMKSEKQAAYVAPIEMKVCVLWLYWYMFNI